MANATAKAVKQMIPEGPTILVAYSLGARIALQILADGSLSPGKTLLVSANPGLEDLEERESRKARDDVLSEQLRMNGLRSFTEKWYQADMWRDFRVHPRFASLAMLCSATKIPSCDAVCHDIPSYEAVLLKI